MKTNNYTLKGFITFFVLWCISSFSLQAQQLTPECYVEIEPNRYVIHFALPPFELHDDDEIDYEDESNFGEDDDCGTFTEIVIGDDIDYDVTDVPGYPALPFFSLNLLLPECVSEVNVYMESANIDYIYPPYLILPAMAGSYQYIQNDTAYSTSFDEECYYAQDYYNDGRDWQYPEGFYQNFYNTSEIYTQNGTKGITLSIYPFSYYPKQWYMDVLFSCRFYVEFDCGDLIETIDEINNTDNFDSFVTKISFDTFNETEIETDPTSYNAKYLIIAARRSFSDVLDPYIAYKRQQNYETEVMYLEDYDGLGSAIMIDYLIHSNYLLSPDFVLLVGDLNDIPLYYPYDNDLYHPIIGRWVVRNDYDHHMDLQRIIDKTIQSETGYTGISSSAVLFSGIDSKKRLSRNFYRSIKRMANKSFDPLGIPYTLYDGRNGNIGFNSMRQSLQATPSFLVYNGHGTTLSLGNNIVSSGISAPYNILPDGFNAASTVYNHISDLNNNNPFPMGFGFACSLNSYETDESFGAEWVNSPNGGVALYASVTTSYVAPDNVLSKRIFKRLRNLTNKIGNFPLGLWLYLGESDYYHAFPTSIRKGQVNKYILIGDPTMYVYGMDSYGEIAPFHMPNSNGKNCSHEASNIIQIDIYDISGKLIQTTNHLQDVDFQSGIYILKYTDAAGNITTQKIIK